MRRRYVILLLICLSFNCFAQVPKQRIAVLDPVVSGNSVGDGIQITIRELVSAAIVNMGQYQVVERSLIEQVMKEQAFSNSGAVDDAQATELGKLVGANKVAVSIVTQVGNQIMLSLKLLDVKTATVESQQVKVLSSETLLTSVEPMAKALCGNSGTITSPSDVSVQGNLNEEIAPSSGISVNEITIRLLKGGYVPEDKIGDVLYVYFDGQFVGKAKVADGFSFAVKPSVANYGKLLADKMIAITMTNADMTKTKSQEQRQMIINHYKSIIHMVQIYDKYQTPPRLARKDHVFTYTISTDGISFIELESVPKGKKNYAIELVKQM